jgi:5-methylcytosine-specific restriction endonuclease McrA
VPKAPPVHKPFGKRRVATSQRKDDAGARLTRKVHNSARWRYQVQPMQLRHHPLCCMCQAEGRVEAAKHVDHIRPLRDGGAAFDPSNLRSLCHAHHSSVTRQWQNQRGDQESSAAPAPAYVIA